MVSRPRIAVLLCLVVLAGACSIERAAVGRPGVSAAAGDSVASAEVYAALRLYYARITARDWKVLALSFWPRVTVTTIQNAPPGAPEAGDVATSPIEALIARAAAMKDCPVSMSAEMIRATVVTYGPLADAWVTYRAHCGVTRDSVTAHYGIDAIHLIRHHGEWRIAGLTFTHEIPGAPLGRP
jgi:hypothetical protein